MKRFFLSCLALGLLGNLALAASPASLEIQGGGPLAVGQTAQLTVVARDAAGQVLETPEVEWTSSDALAVEIDDRGNISVNRLVARNSNVFLTARVGDVTARTAVAPFGLGVVGGTLATYTADGQRVESLQAVGLIDLQLPTGALLHTSPEVTLTRPDGTRTTVTLPVSGPTTSASQLFVDVGSPPMKGTYRASTGIENAVYSATFEIDPEVVAEPLEKLRVSLASPGALKVEGEWASGLAALDLHLSPVSGNEASTRSTLQTGGTALPALLDIHDLQQGAPAALPPGQYTVRVRGYNFSEQERRSRNLPAQLLLSVTPLPLPLTVP